MATDQEFIAAVKTGDTDSVDRILDERPDFAEVLEDGLSAMMIAAYYGHLQVARSIAARAANVTMFEAATIGDCARLESQLAQDSSTINAFSPDGFTALGLAAYFGHLDVAKTLLKHRADPSLASRNSLGVMPLHSALSSGHREIVRLLVDNGAEVNVARAEGWTPLHYTAQAGDVELTEFLLQHGAYSRPGPRDKTPADIAEDAGHADLAEVLRHAR